VLDKSRLRRDGAFGAYWQTEPAVDDLAARIDNMELAARRRSASRRRRSSGPLVRNIVTGLEWIQSLINLGTTEIALAKKKAMI
jgi:hypothetical protein